MLAIDDFEELRRQAAAAARTRDEAAGRLAALTDRLAAEFGVTTPAAARALLEELKADELALAEQYAAARADFVAAWRHVLTPGDTPDARPDPPGPKTPVRRPACETETDGPVRHGAGQAGRRPA